AAVLAFLPSGLLAAPQDSPPPPTPPGPWLRVESDHFTLFGDRPEEELLQTAIELERLRSTLTLLAPGNRLDPYLPARLYLFRSATSFAPFRLPGAGSMDAGYLLETEEASYGALVGGRPSYLILRQYVRDFLDRQLPGLPAWLRTGFAEYYGTFEADDTEARIGLPSRRHLDVLSRRAELIPTAELVAMEAPAGEEAAPTTGFDPAAEGPVAAGNEDIFASFGPPTPFESQSWAAVHYLMGGDEGERRRLGDYIRRVVAAEDPLAAFRSALGMEPVAFDRALAEYVRGTTFSYLRVPVERSAKPLAAEPMTPAEVAYHLGDLLLHLGPSHRDGARQRLRRAVELDPGNGRAWAGLGRLHEAAGDDAATLEAYGKAVALLPDDAGVQVRYGQARLRSLGGRRASDEAGQAAVAAARGAFRRAAELRPGSGEAWAGLGQAGVLAAEPDPEAVAALERALELLPPGRADVLFNLLLARARVGDAAGVDRAIADLRAAGADDTLLVRAREVRLQLTLQEAHRLATNDRLDDAVALLAVVQAESTNPAVSEQAAALFDKLERAERHNRFAEAYTEAVRLYHAGDLEAAAAAVEAMLAEAA
ncbi:MAG TPA: hypothetical protein VLF66_09385, partial [Thermoanaerobaculia bacterium]|nr:hypothetical protein [Thermoanaerobaculia bacterium]